MRIVKEQKMKNSYNKYNDVKIISPRVIKIPSKPAEVDISEYRDTVIEACEILEDGGYNSVSQIIGYILSDDPAHISNFRGARGLISGLDRDTLLEEIVKYYLDGKNKES